MSAPKWTGYTGLVESGDSGQWQLGERVVARQVFKGPYSVCLAAAPMRGALGTGAMAGLRVASSTVTRGPGGIGTLVIEYEPDGAPPTGSQLPATQVTVEAERQERPIHEHPRYSELTAAQIQAAKRLAEMSPTDDLWIPVYESVYGDPNPLVRELAEKLARAEQYYVVYCPVITIVTYHWTPPSGLTMGGYIEDPPEGIIQWPSGQYLRAADTLRWDGSHWELRQQWIGAPEWDADIYGRT